MKKFLMKLYKNFDYFWSDYNSGWLKHWRTFVMALTLFYITEVLFLESKMFYLILLVWHTTINFILVPWWAMHNTVNNEVIYKWEDEDEN